MNLNQAIAGVKQVKQDLVTRKGKGTDIKAMLDLQGVNGRVIAEVNAPTRDDALQAVAATIAATRPSIAIFMCDTYTFTGGSLATLMMMNNYALGDLADRFKAGDPHVKEALWVSGRSSKGETIGHALPYEYEGRQLHWLPEQLDSPTFIGDFADALEHGFDLVAANADPGAQMLRAKELGVQMNTEEAIRAALPGRNEPCFCGSGRKYKACHGRP